MENYMWLNIKFLSTPTAGHVWQTLVGEIWKILVIENLNKKKTPASSRGLILFKLLEV